MKHGKNAWKDKSDCKMFGAALVMLLFVSVFASGEQVNSAGQEEEGKDESDGSDEKPSDPDDPSTNTDAATTAAASTTTSTTSGASTLFSTKSKVFLVLISLKFLHV